MAVGTRKKLIKVEHMCVPTTGSMVKKENLPCILVTPQTFFLPPVSLVQYYSVKSFGFFVVYPCVLHSTL